MNHRSRVALALQIFFQCSALMAYIWGGTHALMLPMDRWWLFAILAMLLSQIAGMFMAPTLAKRVLEFAERGRET